MTRDEAVAIVAEALRNAPFRWDAEDVAQKAAEVAVDALQIEHAEEQRREIERLRRILDAINACCDHSWLIEQIDGSPS